MAKTVKLELNREGVRELLKSDEAMAVCQRLADAALGNLGDGYETSPYRGENRVNVSIAAVTWKAYRENLQSNTVLKAL